MTQLKPRTATMVIYQGDDMARLALLRRQVDQAIRNTEDGQGRVDDDVEHESVTAAKAAYDAAVDEAAGRAVTIELQAIGRKRFRDLMAAHPPRMVTKTVHSPPDEEGVSVPVDDQVVHEDDEGYDVNTETFSRALLVYAEPGFDPAAAEDGVERQQTILAPAFVTDAGRERFVDDTLAEGDFDQAWMLAYALNRQPSADPSRSRYSDESQSSTETDA